MSSYKDALTVITIIVLAISTIYVSVIILTNELWAINQSDKTNTIPIVLSYPDSMFMPLYENATICTVKFVLKFNGTLNENTQVEIVNATCMSYVTFNTEIIIGFPQAIKYDQKATITNNSTYIGWGGTNVLLFRDNYTEVESHFKPVADWHPIYPEYQEEIYFPVSGDYYPIIEISLVDNPFQTPIIYRYDQIKVHVASASEIDALNINQVNLNLSVVLFALAWIEGLFLLYELRKKEKEESQFPINISISPDTAKATPPINNQKQTDQSSKEKPNIAKTDINGKESKEKTINNKPSKDKT